MLVNSSALRSLKRMFPNLRVIGGQELIMNYALVIYQNTHLVEVGLPKLTTIINGGVRIMDNTQLCYSRYIDWGTMLIGPANDILIDQSKTTDSGLIFPSPSAFRLAFILYFNRYDMFYDMIVSSAFQYP